MLNGFSKYSEKSAIVKWEKKPRDLTYFFYLWSVQNFESKPVSGHKVGCVFPIVFVYVLPHAGFGQNAPHIIAVTALYQKTANTLTTAAV